MAAYKYSVTSRKVKSYDRKMEKFIHRILQTHKHTYRQPNKQVSQQIFTIDKIYFATFMKQLFKVSSFADGGKTGPRVNGNSNAKP